MAKKCPPGKYYCFDDKKCKKIPRGYHIGARGYLARDDDNETKKNGNGNSNGNGNGGNGAGNGNGGSGGGSNGNGGGVSEEVAMKEGMYNHPEFALITVAVDELEKGLMDLEGITYDSVDKLMQGIAKRNNISPTLLHNQFKSKHLTIPDDWAIKQRMRRMREGVEDVLATPVFSSKKSKNMSSIKKITSVPVKKAKVVEEKMTEKEKKKKEDIVKGMKKNKSGFKKRYGDDAKSVMYATATKLAMKEEESKEEMLARVRKAQTKIENEEMGIKSSKPIKKTKLKKSENKFTSDEPKPENEFHSENHKYNVSEEGLRAWFGKSSGTTKSGRKVKGWVQVGGKYDGKPCARQPGQKSTPKCVSSSKRRSMSDKERDSAARRKRAADPNQPQKSGAAKPTNVSTDPKRKMKENYFNRNKVVEGYKGTMDMSKSHPEALKRVEDKIAKHFGKPKKKKTKVDESLTAGAVGTAAALGAAGGAASAIAQNLTNKAMKKRKKSKDTVNEAKDKKGKGSGTKDACYHKVKSRYSVWPSAYASGALVKCRKKGAANWGNKSKNEGFSPMQIAALEVAGMIEIKEGQKCWKGYEKKGTKMMFGKRYNNCVKKKTTSEGLMDDITINPKKHQSKAQKIEARTKSDNPNEAAVAKKKLEQERAKEPKLIDLKNSYAPVTEGVAFLKRKKEKKNSEVERKPKKAMDAGARLRRKKQRQEYAAKISGSEDNVPDDIRDHVELTAESKTRLVKNGHTYKVILTWRGKTYMVQMFVPSVSRPTRVQIEKEVQKLYPDAKVMSFLPRDLEPGEPTVMMGEEQDSEINKKIKNIKDDPRLKKIEKDPKGAEIKSKIEKETGTNIRPYSEGQNYEFMKQYAQKEKEKKMKKEVKKNLETYEGDEQHNTRMGEAIEPEGMKLRDVERIKRQKQLSDAAKKAPEVKNKIVPIKTEEVIHEDDMKGMSVSSGHKRPTKSGAGMTAKGVAAYRRRNPGSKLKTAVTGKVKKGSKDAKRRKSYCARSAGQMKKFPKAAKDPNSRLRQARRRWKC